MLLLLLSVGGWVQVPLLQLAEGNNLVQTRAIIGFIADTYGLAGDKEGSPMQRYVLEEVRTRIMRCCASCVVVVVVVGANGACRWL